VNISSGVISKTPFNTSRDMLVFWLRDSKNISHTATLVGSQCIFQTQRCEIVGSRLYSARLSKYFVKNCLSLSLSPDPGTTYARVINYATTNIRMMYINNIAHKLSEWRRSISQPIVHLFFNQVLSKTRSSFIN